MKKIYYLSTCDTCKKIMKETGISAATGFELQDIKTQPVTASQLAAMKKRQVPMKRYSANGRSFTRSWD